MLTLTNVSFFHDNYYESSIITYQFIVWRGWCPWESPRPVTTLPSGRSPGGTWLSAYICLGSLQDLKNCLSVLLFCIILTFYSVMPLFMAAMHFYLIPPTGNTCPDKLIYPVIDSFSFTWSPLRREARQVTMVTPADGPSFFIDPSGKWMCKSNFYRSSKVYCRLIIWLVNKQIVVRLALIQLSAILTLSFMI